MFMLYLVAGVALLTGIVVGFVLGDHTTRPLPEAPVQCLICSDPVPHHHIVSPGGDNWIVPGWVCTEHDKMTKIQAAIDAMIWELDHSNTTHSGGSR